MEKLELANGESLASRYDMHEPQLLGRGKFSTVHRTQRRADGLNVAIKTIQARAPRAARVRRPRARTRPFGARCLRWRRTTGTSA